MVELLDGYRFRRGGLLRSGYRLGAGVGIAPGLNADVSVTMVDDIAPAGMMFEVTGLTEDQYLNAAVLWEFTDSDPDNYPLVRHDQLWTDNGRPLRRFATGPKASRVFETAETVSWTCDIYHNGEYQQITGSHVVRDPDVVYGDAATFYVSPSSDFPVGATNTFTDIASAVAAADGATGGVGAQILLNRGEVFSHVFARGDFGSSLGYGLSVGAYGTGTKPVITSSSDSILRHIQRCKFHGISFVSGWDDTTETGTAVRGVLIQPGGSPFEVDTLIHKCDFDGHSISYRAIDFLENRIQILSECVIAGYQDIGVLTSSQKMAIIGCDFGRDPNALGGGKGKDSLHNQHGPARLEVVDSCVIHGNDMFSNAGWTQISASDYAVSVGADGGTGKMPADQPCLRINTHELANPDAEIGISSNLMEGGFEIVALKPANTTITDYPQLCVAEGNALLASSNTLTFFVVSRGGTAIRNNLAIVPDVPTEYIKEASFCSVGQGDNPSPDNATRPIIVENNTIWSLKAAPPDFFIDDLSVFAGSREAGNLIHAPNLPAPLVSAAPVDLVPTAVPPRYIGSRWEDSPTLNTEFATPANAVQLLRPAAGSAVIDGSVAPQVRLDLFGNIRSDAADDGALESVEVAPSGFELVDAYAEDSRGFFLDPRVATSIYQTDAGATQSAPGDTVGLWEDQSKASGVDASQAVAVSRPLLGAGIVTFDGSNDFLSLSLPVDQRTADMTIFVVLRTSDTKAMLLATDDTATAAGIIQSGTGSSTAANAGTGQTVFVDGVSVANTRSALSTAVSNGSPHIIEFKGLDLTATPWGSVLLGKYVNAGFEYAGDLGPFMLMTTTQADLHRDDIMAKLAERRDAIV